MTPRETELIVSIHIPKTGGESFRDLLESLADGHLQRDYGDRPLAPMSRLDRFRLARQQVELEPGTTVVHGHFIATKYWRRYPDARYVAWFREPVERLASHYHYWKRHPDRNNPTCRRLIDEDLSLGAFAALPEMRDVQSRFLGRVPVPRLAFVGLTERFDQSIELFRRSFFPDSTVTTLQANANPERAGATYELEPATRSALEQLNRADMKLYAAARIRYEQLLREYGLTAP